MIFEHQKVFLSPTQGAWRCPPGKRPLEALFPPLAPSSTIGGIVWEHHLSSQEQQGGGIPSEAFPDLLGGEAHGQNNAQTSQSEAGLDLSQDCSASAMLSPGPQLCHPDFLPDARSEARGPSADLSWPLCGVDPSATPSRLS